MEKVAVYEEMIWDDILEKEALTKDEIHKAISNATPKSPYAWLYNKALLDQADAYVDIKDKDSKKKRTKKLKDAYKKVIDEHAAKAGATITTNHMSSIYNNVLKNPILGKGLKNRWGSYQINSELNRLAKTRVGANDKIQGGIATDWKTGSRIHVNKNSARKGLMNDMKEGDGANPTKEEKRVLYALAPLMTAIEGEGALLSHQKKDLNTRLLKIQRPRSSS